MSANDGAEKKFPHQLRRARLLDSERFHELTPKAFGVDRSCRSVTLRGSVSFPVSVCCRARVQRDRLHASSCPTDGRRKTEARKISEHARIGIGVTGRIAIAQSESETESDAEKIEEEKSQLGRGHTNAEGQKEKDARARRNACAKAEIEKKKTKSCAGENPEEIRDTTTV
jgi:hypothetical protein